MVDLAFDLGLSDLFEYLCHWSTAIRNILMLTVWEWTLVVRIWRLQSQILRTKVYPRAARVNTYVTLSVLSPWADQTVYIYKEALYKIKLKLIT